MDGLSKSRFLRRLAVLMASIVGIAGGAYLLNRLNDDRLLTLSPETTSAPTTSDQPLLLSEICFQPATGSPQFVELKNAGGAVARFDSLRLRNETGDEWRFPPNLTLPPNGLLLVLFDGQNRVEGSIVHADRARFLSEEPSGAVELVSQERVEDRVGWGSQPDASRLGRGGLVPPFPAGGTLARLPRSTTAANPTEWLPFDAGEATPGRSNPEPRVTILLPLDGAMVRKGEASLSWYVVPGATRYRIQMAREDDAEFRQPIVDRMVSSPPISTTDLSTGSFRWRVEAVAEDGTPSGFSSANRIEIQPSLPTSSSSGAAGAAPGELRRVPLIKQRKDTRMIRLETHAEDGPHAWNVGHPDLDGNDESDAGNCAPASIAMMTAHYGGRLSQDRINFYIWENKQEGPENDLRPDFDGTLRPVITRSLEFALGRRPTWEVIGDLEREENIRRRNVEVALTNNSPVATEAPSGVANETLIRTRLEKGIPMLAANSNHAYVLSGLTPDGAVMFNDPGSGIYFTREPMLHLLAVWSMAKPGLAELLPGEITPRSDEDAITTDSDRDGIVDFDEVHRFKTDPHKRDTDGDEVPDFQDLRASIFESPWGYRFRGSWIPRTAIADWTRGAVPMGIDEFHGTVVRTHGRDFDGDRKPMELDEDSDAGGCFDGLEDTNVNGKHEPQQKESYNFSNDDDSCLKGSYEMVTDTVSHANGPAGTIASKIRHAATFSLRPQPDGKLKGIGVFSFTTDTAQQVPPTGCLSKIISPQPTRWTVTLEGDSRRLADGSSEISVNSIPSQGPLHPFRWINDCPPGASGSDLMPTLQWFGFRAKLVNSKYEHRVDTPLAPQVTGTQYTELRVEQPGTGK